MATDSALRTSFSGAYDRSPLTDRAPKGLARKASTIAAGYGIEQHAHERDGFRNHLLDLLASLYVAGTIVFTVACLEGCIIACTSTCLYWYYAPEYAVSMSWTVVSLAVVFPLSSCIGMGFKRREEALKNFAFVVGHLKQVWGAAHTWTVKDASTGQWKRVLSVYDEQQQSESMSKLYEEFIVSMITYFHTPRYACSRSALPGCCTTENTRDEIQQRRTDHSEYRTKVVLGIGRLQRMVQCLKCTGVSTGEVSRLDQYISKTAVALESLFSLKEYRTPQGFRSFARAYILFLGVFYGPYYVYLGKTTTVDVDTGIKSYHENLQNSLVFACLVQIVLSGLYTIMQDLEDPFAKPGDSGSGMDDIHVLVMLEQTRRELVLIEESATEAWKSNPHCGDGCEDTEKTNEKMADQGSEGDQLVGLDPNQL